jgi:RecA/RadA recombinase
MTTTNHSLSLIENFLNDKSNSKYHYNNHQELDYKIPTGSLHLDLALNGGFCSGAHRFTGVNEGGKTSCALTVAKNFQNHFKKDGMVIYVKSEGRLSKELLSRCGVDQSPDKFFRFDCNVYEKVFELLRELISNNPENKKYLFIIDSVDALCRLIDYEKAFEDSEQVAGGALITSVFLKKVILPLTKMGHMLILTSQVRVEVATNPYASRGGPKVKQAGGNAIKHYANFILEFQERYSTEIMYTNPSASRLEDKGDPIGHYCKIIFRKSVNEKTGACVKYPIRYGRKDGNSIWVEKELVDLMKNWGFLEQKGAWISIDEDLRKKLELKKLELPEKIQGENKLLDILESDDNLREYIFDMIKEEILSL